MEEQSNYSAAHKGKESKEKKSGQKHSKSQTSHQAQNNLSLHKRTNVQHAQERKLQARKAQID